MKHVIWITCQVILLVGVNACGVTKEEGSIASRLLSDPSSVSSEAGQLTGQDSIKQADLWMILDYGERKGKRLYEHYCAVCHGSKGEGDGFNAFNLDPRPRNLADSTYMTALSNETLSQIITFGGRGMNRSVLMPAYQNTLTPDQISHVIAYIRTFGQRAPETD